MDTFDRARAYSAAGMVAAGVATIIGTVLDWVTVTPPKIIPADLIPQTEPFTGLETKSAPYLLIAAGVIVLCALMLVWRQRTMWAWIGFGAAMVIGGLAFQNYRGLNELFYDQKDGIGEPAAAIGLMLVVAGGIAGLIASAAGVAAAPPTTETETT
jgi:hypothetical protein